LAQVYDATGEPLVVTYQLVRGIRGFESDVEAAIIVQLRRKCQAGKTLPAAVL